MHDLIGPATQCFLAYTFRYENERAFFATLRSRFAVQMVPADHLHPAFRGPWLEVYLITQGPAAARTGDGE
jgi:hypothetical protein